MAFVVRWLSKPAVFAGAVLSTACSSTPTIGPSVAGLVESGSTTPPVRLVECPSSPNCISSVTADTKKQTAPFNLAGLDVVGFQSNLVSAIENDGGVVRDAREGYIWATYTSSVFRFVDDTEWLFNQATNQFDVRSASRVGYSDLGVNRKRVERLRSLINP